MSTLQLPTLDLSSNIINLNEATQATEELRTACRNLYSMASQPWQSVKAWFSGGETSYNALKGLANQVMNEANRLSPDSGDKWLKYARGEWSWSKWKSEVEAQRKVVVSCYKEIGMADFSWSRLSDEVVDPTAAEVKEGINDAKWGAMPLLIVVAVIVVALAVVKVA